MTELDLGAYAHTLLDEVRARTATDGCDPREAFTQLMLEQFCADGHTEDAKAVHHRDHGVEVSGYGASSDDRCLDIFLAQYSPRADDDHKIDRGAVEAAFNRMENFLARCVSGKFRVQDSSSDLAALCAAIIERFGQVEKVRLVLITNARSVMRDRLPPLLIHGRQVSRDVWDLRRLANWAASGSKAEPIVAEFPEGLRCLATPPTDEDFSVLLAIVPGADLAELYSTYGARLLELNVRSFLQLRGNVNKGILDTLRNNPGRFLAYNNGIAGTASAVDFEDVPSGGRRIRRIHNLQIVNGGQTTATIHHARRNKIDISGVLVQMKLTVVAPDQLDDIVPQISAYSNTQNKVTASDLKANSGFHVEVERIMRTLWAPATAVHPHDTHWFYERARGQYANALARESSAARQKIFRTVNPPTQKFIKSELAKFENSWEMLPHLVSLGAEKNFVLFTERIDSDGVAVDKDYCRHLVAKAILFRRTDRIVAKQNFGGFKANIVTYTIAKLVQATGRRLDLERIWRDQSLTPALQESIVEVCILVQKVIISPPDGRTNLGEWTKRQECWEAVRDIDWVVPRALEAELVEVDTYESDLRLVRSIPSTEWSEMAAWGVRTGALDDAECRAATEIAHALDDGCDPAGRHARAGVALIRHASSRGFRPAAGP